MLFILGRAMKEIGITASPRKRENLLIRGGFSKTLTMFSGLDSKQCFLTPPPKKKSYYELRNIKLTGVDSFFIGTVTTKQRNVRFVDHNCIFVSV